MAAQPQSWIAENQAVVIRRATPVDAEVCGRICFEAFGALAEKHNFPNDFPAPEIPAHVTLDHVFAPVVLLVVAERDGKVVGSNCLDERAPIAGVGPITIDPSAQNRSVGRQLMQAVMTRAAETKFAGVRLVQAAYHNRSLSLYAKLGFVVREPLACMQGTPIQKTPLGYHVRVAEPSDLEPAMTFACESTDDRGGGSFLKTRFSKEQPSSPNRRGESKHTHRPSLSPVMRLGEANRDLQALIAAATEFQMSGNSNAHSQRGAVPLMP